MSLRMIFAWQQQSLLKKVLADLEPSFIEVTMPHKDIVEVEIVSEHFKKVHHLRRIQLLLSRITKHFPDKFAIVVLPWTPEEHYHRQYDPCV